MTTKAGFYWVFLSGAWCPAEAFASGEWAIPGTEQTFSADQLTIGPRLEPPDGRFNLTPGVMTKVPREPTAESCARIAEEFLLPAPTGVDEIVNATATKIAAAIRERTRKVEGPRA